MTYNIKMKYMQAVIVTFQDQKLKRMAEARLVKKGIQWPAGEQGQGEGRG